MIHVSISKFNNTIKDLTEITKVQKDLNEDLEYVSFTEITEDIKRDIQKLIEESGVVLKEVYEVQQIVYAKKNLRSVLYNLLTNGIKYRSPERSPQILIHTYQEEAFIVVSVEDNGLGLNAVQQSKLFTMFKRMHTHVDGSGIGLYIVKRIVENNGGKIEVESEPGKGTTFKVYFKQA
jgi:signal transduction histidine kinase